MRRVILMLLAVVSNCAMAEWVQIGSSDDGAMTVYANPATLRKVGNKVKMWDLGDYKIAQDSGKGDQFMSIRGQSEYNCKEEQYRTLYLSFHSGNMGAGEIIGSHPDPKKWLPVMPESLIEALWKFACGKP
jgi:hypothetical protein